MTFHDKEVAIAIKEFGSDAKLGLNFYKFNENLTAYGKNVLTEKKGKGIFHKILS